MNRQLAIQIAQRCAKAKPQSYYSEPFQPHEWVIDAIMEAGNICQCWMASGDNPVCPKHWVRDRQAALMELVREGQERGEYGRSENEKEPTIAELEQILNDKRPHEIYMLPNGEVRARRVKFDFWLHVYPWLIAAALFGTLIWAVSNS